MHLSQTSISKGSKGYQTFLYFLLLTRLIGYKGSYMGPGCWVQGDSDVSASVHDQSWNLQMCSSLLLS